MECELKTKGIMCLPGRVGEWAMYAALSCVGCAMTFGRGTNRLRRRLEIAP